MVVTFSEIETDFMAVQSEKALLPIEITLSGMFTSVMVVFPLNAFSSIVVMATPPQTDGIMTFSEVPW